MSTHQSHLAGDDPAEDDRARVADRLGLRPEDVTPYRERDRISAEEERATRRELDDLEDREEIEQLPPALTAPRRSELRSRS